ncbi:hypothetical protein PFTANZ_02726 [Plasmodium falciparum Tanzania (2000708)]|uniref:Surface antigen n=1 Tax=Plasmodium falciparum Tanzania (2000708) TaxID=1036725 RepID=A0A024W8Q0_PLAFA|nr:hypothetical protein PFTANZ_02726 [Plasmodium falciparum Tanzania (2000708)]
MKLHYSNILLFFFPLNILVTSYHEHNNKNKSSITPRYTQRYTSRVLSKCDIRSSIYDNDAQMKSVKENFDRKTSQRFDEYEERMKGKRQKRKEERDKNIQEIIEKDRMHKLLAEKVEKGCLKYGCGLGGVAASVYNKNKIYITPHHTTTTTLRMLSEYGVHTSIYKNDENMKSLKENFDRQTSQRFEEYEQRMIRKRKKYKEQCDKDIQKIIEKDKMDKSLAEKVETGCLKYGCGLGGVAGSVGLFGGFGIYGWKTAALAASKNAAVADATAKGVAKAIDLVKSTFDVQNIAGQPLKTFFTATNYTNKKLISESIYMQYQSTCLYVDAVPVTGVPEPICISIWDKSLSGLGSNGVFVKETEVIETTVRTIVSDAKTVFGEALEKKMNKKAHYTKLLNQKIYSFKILNPFLCCMNSRCLNT